MVDSRGVVDQRASGRRDGRLRPGVDAGRVGDLVRRGSQRRDRQERGVEGLHVGADREAEGRPLVDSRGVVDQRTTRGGQAGHRERVDAGGVDGLIRGRHQRGDGLKTRVLRLHVGADREAESRPLVDRGGVVDQRAPRGGQTGRRERVRAGGVDDLVCDYRHSRERGQRRVEVLLAGVGGVDIFLDLGHGLVLLTRR